MHQTFSRWCFTPTEAEKDFILSRFDDNLVVPKNFQRVPSLGNTSRQNNSNDKQPSLQINAQTTELCEKLGIDDPLVLLLRSSCTVDTPNVQTSDQMNTTVSFIDYESDTYDEDTNVQVDETVSESNNFKLNLPSPKIITDAILEEDDFDKEGPKKEIVLDNEASDVGKSREVNESCNIPSKKFKRRNANIYNSED